MKDNNIIITLENKEKKSVRTNIALKDIIKDLGLADKVLLCRVNGSVMELNETINKNSKIEFITLEDKIGRNTYKSGLKFLYITAIKELYGLESTVKICHSLDQGLYTEINIKKPINENIVKEIKNKMKELSKADLNIDKLSALRKSVIEYDKENNEYEKVGSLSQLNSEYITMYELKEYYNYFFTYMPSSTGILNSFDLTYIKPDGIVLRFPLHDNLEVPKFIQREKVLGVFKSYNERMKMLGINYVCDVNNAMIKGNIDDLINMNELIHSDKLGEIAKNINNHKDKIKVILIAGPSCSGKTTTAKKLGLFLRIFGFKPFTISIDDYFKERVDTPLDEHGKYDYECIDAIDIKLFNSDLKKLINGKYVKMPTYNFVTGAKEFKKKEIKLEKDNIIIIEGLHALNDKLTSSISKENKYKIYVSPFTPLGIDAHNHISTIDLRLLRRIVRDNTHRGYSAEQTLINWDAVRRGEDKYIFPYQSEADVIYNTALIYEIGVLKTYVEPLLYSLESSSQKYEEAQRLITFLKCFFAIPETEVPDTSVLREFVGRSYFE